MNGTDNSLHQGPPSAAGPTLAAKRWPRWPRTIARIAAGALAALAIVAVTGVVYEQVAAMGDASAYPPAGRLVDIGGYSLHLDCRGKGTPTVVMDAGLGASSLDWILVQPELARTTRVCTYDRAGMGSSDPGPLPRSPGRLAEELHLLLEKGGVRGPYILVAHSLAAKNVRMFASAYPADVAGMVLVDARSELMDIGIDAEPFRSALNDQAFLYSVARRFGIARLFGSALIGQPRLQPDIATRMALAATAPKAITTTTEEGLARSADDTALATATLGSIPLVVIAAGDSMAGIPNWPVAQSKMAQLSTRGRLVIAEASSHSVQLDQPNVVLGAVRDVLADIRTTR